MFSEDIEAMDEMPDVSGFKSFGDSMFEHLGGGNKAQQRRGPVDPDLMRLKMDRATTSRKAEVEGFFVETYNLSNKEEAKAYCDMMHKIYDGIAKGTHVIAHKDKQFVPTIDPPAWIVHMEWIVISLKEDRVPLIGEEKNHE